MPIVANSIPLTEQRRYATPARVIYTL